MNMNQPAEIKVLVLESLGNLQDVKQSKASKLFTLYENCFVIILDRCKTHGKITLNKKKGSHSLSIRITEFHKKAIILYL